jgi:hypothetical protein
MPTDPLWRVLLLIVLSALIWAWESRQYPQSSPGAVQRQRLLQPRTPEDCPVCRQQAAPTATAVARHLLTPWSAVKSRRGAMGRIVTQGFACPNRMCAVLSDYRRAGPCPLWRRHAWALRADSDVARERRVVPPAARGAGTPWVTPLYRLKTASQRVAEVLTALVLGSLSPPQCGCSATVTPRSRDG